MNVRKDVVKEFGYCWGLLYHPVENPGKNSRCVTMCVRIYFGVIHPIHLALERRLYIVSLNLLAVNMGKVLQ
jgi:hypothetical protein